MSAKQDVEGTDRHTCYGMIGRHHAILVLLCLPPILAFAAAKPSSCVQNQPLPEPALFGEGVVSTTENEMGTAFSPDGNSVYFAVGTANGSFSAIVVSHFKAGRWNTPEMADFSGQHNDRHPVLSPDGSKLFFASTRPLNSGPKSDMDIWMVEKTPSGWSEPRNLGAPVNTAGAETHPYVTRDSTLYFSSNRSGGQGRADIYRSRLINGHYAEPENLGPEINDAADAWMGCLTTDENTLIFARRRGSQSDLYLSRKHEGVWQSPVDFGAPINTFGDETSPSITPDGQHLFFTRSQPPEQLRTEPRTTRITRADLEAEFKKREGNVLNGQGNLYQVDITTITAAIARADTVLADVRRVWKPKRPVPSARIFEIAASINGKISTVTSGEDNTPGGDVFEYDPANDTWRQKQSANQPRNSFGAGAVNGKIFIWSGNKGMSNSAPELLNTVEEYDPATDTWRPREPIPRPRRFAKGAAAGGKLYAVCGEGLIDEYDPVADKWVARSAKPGRQQAGRIAGVNGKIYMNGGFDPCGRTVMEYDPALDKWTKKTDMLSPRSDFGVATTCQGQILAFGGSSRSDGITAEVEAYDPASDQWTARTRMPTPNWEQVGAEVDGKVYVIAGGFPPDKVFDALYEYRGDLENRRQP